MNVQVWYLSIHAPVMSASNQCVEADNECAGVVTDIVLLNR